MVELVGDVEGFKGTGISKENIADQRVALGSDIGKRRQTSLIASSSRRARVGS